MQTRRMVRTKKQSKITTIKSSVDSNKSTNENKPTNNKESNENNPTNTESTNETKIITTNTKSSSTKPSTKPSTKSSTKSTTKSTNSKSNNKSNKSTKKKNDFDRSTNHLITEYYKVTRRKTTKTLKEEQDQLITYFIKNDIDDKESLKIEEFEDKGRGVVTCKRFTKGSFICEYRGDLIDVQKAKVFIFFFIHLFLI